MARVCVFDVNETLLDLGALDPYFEAAFVARPGMVLDPLADRPDVVGADLREVAIRILEIESG
jgi:2-haloacid dehalogenase